MQIKWLILWFIIIWAFMALIGCAPIRGVNNTIFLIQKDSRIYTEHNQNCIVSGYTINRDNSSIKERFKMTTYYSNCPIWEDKYLEEFELKDWILPPPPKGDTYGPK